MRIKMKKGTIDDFKMVIDYIKEKYKLDPDDINLYISFKTKYGKFDFYDKDSLEHAYIDMDIDDELNFDNLVPLTKKDYSRITDIINSNDFGLSIIKKKILKYLFYRIYGELNDVTSQKFREIERDELLLDQLVEYVKNESDNF